jgi:hypothetical protein
VRRTDARRLLVALALVGVVAAGCGDDGGGDGGGDAGAATDGDAGTDGGAGDVWTGELEDGSALAVRLEVPPDDPAVAPFAALRETFGLDDEVVWIVGEVTVPEGVDGTGRFVTFLAEGADPLADDPLDPDDGISNAEFACSRLDDWFSAAGDPTDAQLAAYDEVLTDTCGGQTLQVPAPGGTTTTYVMVHPAPLPDVATVRAGLATELTR